MSTLKHKSVQTVTLKLHTLTITLPRTLTQNRTSHLFFDLFWSNELAFTNMCNVFKPWNAVLPEEIQNFSTAILRLTCNWSDFPPKVPSGTILVAIEFTPKAIDEFKLYPCFLYWPMTLYPWYQNGDYILTCLFKIKGAQCAFLI